LLTVGGSQARAATCENLASLTLPDTTITSATTVTPPMSIETAPGFPSVEIAVPFCRVAATLKPTADSDIKVEVWLPLAGSWNGRLEGIGNGGLGGAIPYQALAEGLGGGYATAATDTGHDNRGGPGVFALGHPEKIVDYGHRAVHLTALAGQAIAAAYYGRPAKHAYFVGCSQGGQEALMEAQRYPTDYDGIIAGDPDYNQTHHEVGAHLWIPLALSATLGSAISADKALLIGHAVNDACDALDGVNDGVLEDPRRCHFDPAKLKCKSTDAADCLTTPQVEAVRKIWGGPRKILGTSYYPGLERGGEAETWKGWIVSTTSSDPEASYHRDLGLPFFKYFVFSDPKWDSHTFNFKTDPLLIDQKLAAALNATDPDLRPFKRRGGKLLHYHGYSDADIPPRSSINYYQRVTKTLGGRSQVDPFYRLFMVPGMGHCGGGPGANSFDMLPALQQWVEHGMPPAKVVATKYIDDDPKNGVVRTHPLCPYPQIARYKGTGNTDDAANFKCDSEIQQTASVDHSERR
jgi:feruloyl esterase